MEFSTEVPLVVVLVLCCSVPPSLAQTTNISGSAFNCPPLEMSDGTPTSVHSLRPSDIAVIGAMGDSVTAGFGVLSDLSTIYTEFTEYRGLSWSIGGDASLPYVTTLPNILREYNPDLYGFSTETTIPFGFLDLPNTRLNVASSGAATSDMLQQAQDLVRKIRQSDSVDFDGDWKLVTMYIGSNDICKDSCVDNSTVAEPQGWIQDVADSLDYLKENLPRTFVNLVQISDIGALQSESARSSYGQTCIGFFRELVCPCGNFGVSSLGEQFGGLISEYRQGIQDLANVYNDSDTFTVVLQPYQMEVEFQDVDDAVLSIAAVDCAHLSAEGNRQFAIGLWNNMLERVGGKTTISRLPYTDISCPTEEQPFLFTAQNSMVVDTVAGSPSLHSSLSATSLAIVAMALQLMIKTIIY